MYLSALNNHLKSLKKDTTVIISLINSNMCIIITNYQRNELSDREVKNFVPWSIIVEVYKLLGGTITNDRCYEDYILLRLYIHHPPRRSDYCNMLISDMDISAYKSRILYASKPSDYDWYNNRQIRKEQISNDLKGKYKTNMLIINGDSYYFLFSDYKTFKYYGIQIIELNSELKSVISSYIKSKNLVYGDISHILIGVYLLIYCDIVILMNFWIVIHHY